MTRSYIKKIIKGKKISDFIDTLNQKEIKELVKDVIKKEPVSFDIFPFNRGEDVLISASVYLKKLDKNTRKLINEQIECLLKDYLKKRDESNAEEYINNLLTLHSILGISMSKRLADNIINDPALSTNLKAYAANAFASLNDEVQYNYWDNINISEKPFLSSAVITALTKVSPEKALLKLTELDDIDIDIKILIYPTKNAVKKLILKPRKLRKIFYALNSGGTMRKFFEKILSLKEFPENLLETVTSDNVEKKFNYLYGTMMDPPNRRQPDYYKKVPIALLASNKPNNPKFPKGY
ncbi:MAG: hypothetical protein JRJ49_02610 [Deltaproteobacteria bacterium]|nr:hypothetical protein [Deltaproteobacteria bacterium]